MKKKFLRLSLFLVIMILAIPASVAAQEPAEDVVAPIFRPSPPLGKATTTVTSSLAVSPSQQEEINPAPMNAQGGRRGTEKNDKNVSPQSVSVDDTPTPTQLVAALVGPNVTLGTISYTGNALGSGSFSGGTGIVGFESGIILGSGKATDVVGPNMNDGISVHLGVPGDPDLEALVPQGTTLDATVLEFDFECPGANVMSFRYIFSSEEYNEWVNSQFNDVFAFFLNGTNIALLPDGVTPVSVNTVNNGFSLGGGLPGSNPSNPAFYINNDKQDGGPFVDIEADGLTVVLVAEASTIPGPNHMKLAIADTSDRNRDSWVFLEAGSFQCNQPPIAEAGGPYSGDEGSPIPLDGTGSSDPDGDPLSYSWSVDSALCSFDNPSSPTPNLTCTDDSGAGNFTVTLTVDDGQATDSDTAPVTVFNVAPAPSVTLEGNDTVLEGDTHTYNYTTSDPGDDTFTLDTESCGLNGVLSNSTFDGITGTGSFDCTFTDGPNTSVVLVTVLDDDGASGSDSLTVNILNVAPTPDAGPDQTVFRNDTVNLSGMWTDPAGSFDDPYSWSWDLDGDSAPDSSGSAAYGTSIDETTSFALEGFYTLSFAVTDKDGGTGSDSLVVEVLNQPPDCSNTSPSVDALWPPNHKFVAIDVLGVTDPEGDPIVITIDSIFQDEVVNGKGDGNTSPDGKGVGTSTAKVRAERDGKGNGRVYHINFTADDGHGGSCSGELPVGVGVPHSQNPKEVIIDDGPLYDSTVP